MKIPLPKLMRHWREEAYTTGEMKRSQRFGLAAWAFFARRPRLYQVATRLAIATLGALGRRRGRFSWLPLAGGWTRHRDMPAPQSRTFQQLWAEQRAGAGRAEAPR